MNVKDKVVVITGGASGIGEAGTRIFTENGAKVIMLDVNEEAGKKLEGELSEKGQTAWFIKTDISSEDAVKSAFLSRQALCNYCKDHKVQGYSRNGGKYRNYIFYCKLPHFKMLGADKK